MSLPLAFQPTLPFGDEERFPVPSNESHLVADVLRVCREHPLDEKVLIAPSLPAGHQIVERLARSGASWIHLRVATVRNLAHAAVGAGLAREGRRLISRAQALALVEQACGATLGESSYFGALKDRPGLHRAIHATIDELRSAGLSGKDLSPAALPNAKKRADLKKILSHYEMALQRGRFVDRAEVLRLAARGASAGAGAAGTLYLLPDGADLSPLERTFLERLAGRRLRSLRDEPRALWSETARRARLFRARGEENEIREVFRRVFSEERSFDEVEILHTDSAVYPALVYELSCEHDIPCTFSEGIPVSFTRPGRAGLAFLAWIEEGFASEALRRALASGVITLERLPGAADADARSVARALRDAGIGWGRDRHLERLTRLEAELSGEDTGAREPSELEPAERERRAERRAWRRRGARRAKDFVEAALDLAPAERGETGDLSGLARGARTFVQQFARESSELDGAARTALETLFSEFEDLALVSPSGGAGDAAARLREAVSDLAVASDRPRPGCLHVAHYERGGFSGRRETFLVGLDETRHPRRDLEDPVLLDEERHRINESLREPVLSLGRRRPQESSAALKASLSRISGSFSASYSCFDVRRLSQAAEPSPAPFFLEVHRLASGRPDADYDDLDKSLASPAGFVPGPDAALDDTEWWLSRRDGTEAAAASVLSVHPWLADGNAAENARAGEAFTEWDGRIRGGTPELDPRRGGAPFSASRLETLAHCPFAYFVRHVLGVEAPREQSGDPARWLDALQRGTLLHEIFRDFFERITEAAEKPSVSAHLDALLALADERLAVWRQRIAPRSELSYARDREDVRMACRTLLREEELHCRDVIPKFFEVGFGLARKPAGASRQIESPEPVEIPVGGGHSFRLRGSIDRVDEAPDGTFHVWDYKTGSAAAVREGAGARGGRQIQPALYAAAFEKLLERAGRPGRVSKSGYFFPGRKGEGRRISPAADPNETRAVLDGLFDLLAAGFFPHAPEPEDCKFCQLQLVCGGQERASARAAVKLETAVDPTLQAFRKIHAAARD